MVKNLPANAGDKSDKVLIPGLGRSFGGRNGNPLQYSCLEKNPMDRGVWWAAVHVAQRAGLNAKLQKTQDESLSLEEKIFLKVLSPFIYGPLDPFKSLGGVLKIYYMNHFSVRFAKIRYFSQLQFLLLLHHNSPVQWCWDGCRYFEDPNEDNLRT